MKTKEEILVKLIDEVYEKFPNESYSDFDIAEHVYDNCQPKWIKINSEADLPDHTNDVIALVANDPIQAYFINGKWMGSYDVRSSVEDGWGGNFELCGQSTVTHWMPLPQLPKED